jgi:hypothetical protein
VSEQQEAQRPSDAEAKPIDSPTPSETRPPGPAAPAQPGSPPPAQGPHPWAWPVAILFLAVAGVILALADVAIDGPWLGPLASVMIGRSGVASVPGRPLQKFDRFRFGDRLTLGGPFGRLGRISPIAALRAFLTNSAGLMFLALAALALFPRRARVAVQRFEDRNSPLIALAAGVVTFLFALAATILLGFTLIFLAVIPVVLLFALAASVFGIACISLAFGRLMQRRLNLGSAHPLIAGLAGILIVFDLAVVPFVGIVALAVVVLAGLGLAVVTRFGSESGWSFRELNW